MLAAMLATWRMSGWPEMLGHHPGPDNLIVPYRDGAMYPHRRFYRRFQADLAGLGLRARRFHDLRRTFITLARGRRAARFAQDAHPRGERKRLRPLHLDAVGTALRGGPKTQRRAPDGRGDPVAAGRATGRKDDAESDSSSDSFAKAHSRKGKNGERRRNRTFNLGIKSPLLCQLS